jgi:myo-inositol-1(or 4)-monophosphatase
LTAGTPDPSATAGCLATDLDRAVAAAQEAGAILRGMMPGRAGLAAEEKRAGDFVSAADLRAEAALRAALCRDGDGWLGEEQGEAAGEGRRRWIVDPLDGTTNYLRGLGHWAVSVALEVDGRLRVGVIHDPLRSETFSAREGGGAFLNGVPITPAATGSMRAALFGTGVPFGTMAHIDDHAADIARLMPACAGLRRMGAAALDLAYVACGRLDGFWERRLRPWDIAAGLVILREAGARVEGLDPAEQPERTGTVLAAAPQLFDDFAAILRAAQTGLRRA